MMKYPLTVSAFLSAALASSPLQPNPGPPFTVNLLSKLGDMSITFPETGTTISTDNATIHHTYEDVTYSVIGNAVFTEERVPQYYLIETSQWNANVSSCLSRYKPADDEISIALRKRGQLSHLDIAVSKEEPSGAGMRFDYLSPDHGGVDVSNIATRITPKSDQSSECSSAVVTAP